MTREDQARWARAARLLKQTRATFIRDAINERVNAVLAEKGEPHEAPTAAD